LFEKLRKKYARLNNRPFLWFVLITSALLAQDFHDLTGQVVTKVITLATDLEDSLVKLLVSVVPEEPRERADAGALHGPVVDPLGRTDVVANQGEVDDLLASLGF
jgi:chemotaxis protein CheZ